MCEMEWICILFTQYENVFQFNPTLPQTPQLTFTTNSDVQEMLQMPSLDDKRILKQTVPQTMQLLHANLDSA